MLSKPLKRLSRRPLPATEAGAAHRITFGADAPTFGALRFHISSPASGSKQLQGTKCVLPARNVRNSFSQAMSKAVQLRLTVSAPPMELKRSGWQVSRMT